MKFVVTRPRLAGRLIRAGHKAVETANPFKPEFDAWEFELDNNSVKVIREYYESINHVVPAKIKRWEQEHERL